MTEAQAGPSLRSVVMSLKRIPSVGKSLMSRIFERSSATFMTGTDVTAGSRRGATRNLPVCGLGVGRAAHGLCTDRARWAFHTPTAGGPVNKAQLTQVGQ